jgi:hypothetical protein
MLPVFFHVARDKPKGYTAKLWLIFLREPGQEHWWCDCATYERNGLIEQLEEEEDAKPSRS